MPSAKPQYPSIEQIFTVDPLEGSEDFWMKTYKGGCAVMAWALDATQPETGSPGYWLERQFTTTGWNLREPMDFMCRSLSRADAATLLAAALSSIDSPEIGVDRVNLAILGRIATQLQAVLEPAAPHTSFG